MDELSLVREPTKRSHSVTESLANSAANATMVAVPPHVVSSVSLTTTTRSSSGSLTSSSSNSRPLSLEDDLEPYTGEMERKSSASGGFWLFGRKSVDQGQCTLQRSPRHFSFEELNNNALIKNNLRKQQSSLSVDSTNTKMQREGSQSSLASSIFKKDFWKAGSTTPVSSTGRNPLLNFHSDPSMITTMQRKGSTTSMNPSPSISSEIQHIIKRHMLDPSHPLDNLSTTPSELSDFNWDQ